MMACQLYRRMVSGLLSPPIETAIGPCTWCPAVVARLPNCLTFPKVTLGAREAIGIVLAMVLKAFGVVGWLRAGLRGWLPARRRSVRPVDVRHPDAAFYDEFVAIAKRHGLRRAPHQTPREFAALVSHHLNDRVRVGEVADALYDVEYGNRRLDETRATTVGEILTALRNLTVNRG